MWAPVYVIGLKMVTRTDKNAGSFLVSFFTDECLEPWQGTRTVCV